jgi:hypothetical protein
VTSDSAIFPAAKPMIDQQGEDASVRTSEGVDELLEVSDMIGPATWRRILVAVEDLKRGRQREQLTDLIRVGRPSGSTPLASAAISAAGRAGRLLVCDAGSRSWCDLVGYEQAMGH